MSELHTLHTLHTLKQGRYAGVKVLKLKEYSALLHTLHTKYGYVWRIRI